MARCPGRVPGHRGPRGNTPVCPRSPARFPGYCPGHFASGLPPGRGCAAPCSLTAFRGVWGATARPVSRFPLYDQVGDPSRPAGKAGRGLCPSLHSPM